jgi:serine/threonine-protein kinase RsbW
VAPKCEYSSIRIPNDPKYATAAAIYVSEIARAIGMDAADLKDLENGIMGAITALLGYSFEPAEKSTLEIICERIPEGLMVSLRDKGLPFGVESSSGDQPGMAEPFFRLKEYLDEVQLNNLGPDGKELVLIKHLKNKTISDYYAACDLEPYDPAIESIAGTPGAFKCHVRQMEPKDAAEVSKTIYKTYGYTYPHDHVYYPEKIIALNDSGRVYSAVAIAGDSEIAGYGVFQIWDQNPQIVEMAQGVVKPKYRSMGCFRHITRYLLEQARSRGIKGAFGEAVTNHTVSQHTMHGFDFKDCGLRLGLIPPETVFKGMNAEVSQRVSMLVQFLYLQPPAPQSQTVYAPPHHQDILADLYQTLGVSPRIAKAANKVKSSPSSHAELKIKLIGSMRYARMIVEAYGKNFIAALKTEVRELCLKKIEIINLFLNLSDPLTAATTAQVEKLGFFFGGILPHGFKNGDALILQYLNKVPIDYDAVQVKSAMAQKLLAYVREQDPNLT